MEQHTASPQSYAEAARLVKETWKEAASAGLPKNAWLRQTAGKYCDKLRRSEAWRGISAEYSAIIKEGMKERPIHALFMALADIERRQEAGEAITNIDLAVIGMLHNISKSREYLKTHRERQKLEKRLKEAAEARAKAEEARKSELHTAIMNSPKFAREEECSEMLNLVQMPPWEIMEILGIQQYIARRSKIEADWKQYIEQRAETEATAAREIEEQIKQYELTQKFLAGAHDGEAMPDGEA